MSEGQTDSVTVLIGGDAGQGVESGGSGLALAAARAGVQALAVQDCQSRIRGGHNFYNVRLGSQPLNAHSTTAHLLVALTSDAITAHVDQLIEGGAIILTERIEVGDWAQRRPDLTPVRLPLLRIAEEHGSRLMVNTAALAAAAALIDLPLEAIAGVIKRNFGRKGAGVVGSNLRVAAEAYRLARNGYAGSFPYRIQVPADPQNLLLMNGNQALALGALAGGCRFMSAYPMTPATSIVEWLSALPADYGMVTKHTEDEIAAVCMAIGASFAGARAMTATSGGGFCLMVEAIGLAGMTEVPIVIVNAQRGGPSTGLPTRTEQSDLLFAIHAGHGEFPRVVLAPATVEECFETGWRAFNLADNYQCPVIVMTDTLLASSLKTVAADSVDFQRVRIDRGPTLDRDELDLRTDGYRRFEITESGVSPRAVPGHARAVFRAASDEHDESGHISEEPENRVRMMQKRMRKLDTAEAAMRGPELSGAASADLTLVCWGSTFGPCLEAAELLSRRGLSANVLKFGDLWPLPREAVRSAFLGVRRAVAVELNYTGQLARLLHLEAGISIEHTINKYDGRPFSPEEIADAVMKEVAVGIEA